MATVEVPTSLVKRPSTSSGFSCWDLCSSTGSANSSCFDEFTFAPLGTQLLRKTNRTLPLEPGECLKCWMCLPIPFSKRLGGKEQVASNLRHLCEPWHWVQRHPAWQPAQPPTLRIGSYLPYTDKELLVAALSDLSSAASHHKLGRTAAHRNAALVQPVVVGSRLNRRLSTSLRSGVENSCLGLRNGQELLVQVPIPFQRPASCKQEAAERRWTNHHILSRKEPCEIYTFVSLQ